ncbi:hypothetical protein [Thalassospira xiamenensis]|uniref:hypothetical protein n=1 Tax=Thalassospira xiamenensis TaxID=220697 RepID=UPI001C68E6B2|nr:hypothetical protein [Thalassospira xiamenensis]
MLKQRNAANTAWITRGDLATPFLQGSDVAAGGSAGLLRADGDGSGLTGVLAIDQVARDLAASTLAYAIAQSDAAAIAGSVGQFLFTDNYQSDSLAVKTDAFYDAVNDWYTNQSGSVLISQASGTPIGNMSAFGGLSAAYDGVIDQAEASCAAFDSGAGNATNGKDWGSGNSKTVTRFRVRTPSDKTDFSFSQGSVSLKLQGSTDNFSSSVVDLYTGTTGVPGISTWVDVASGIVMSSAYRYHRVVFGSENGSRRSVAEVEFYEADTATNMILRPSASTILADAQTVLGYFMYYPIVPVTLESDLLCKFSIDGGSAFADASLFSLGTIGGTGKILVRALADVSGQSGTSLIYSLESDNNKAMRVTDFVGAVPFY